MCSSFTGESHSPAKTDQRDAHSATSKPSAILRLPLELRERIYYLALRDTIISGPLHPYDDAFFPEPAPPIQKRVLTLTSLRSVSRQLHNEVDRVFQGDIIPTTTFYFFGVADLPFLSNMKRKLQSHPFLRHARFHLRSPDKETICANDDDDNIWDTLIESQAGCEQVSYEVEPGIIAAWTLFESTPPANRQVRLHLPRECRCMGAKSRIDCIPYRTIPYPPLAKSLRLMSCVWHSSPIGGWISDDLVVCSILDGKFEDLDFDAFDGLARERYRRMAVDFRPPQYWRLYGDGDVERKEALKTELIDVGAEWVVEEQRRRCVID